MEYRLSEIFDLQMGKTPDRHNSEYWQACTEPWISIADLSKCDKMIETTSECISQLAISETGIKVIPQDTVIMSFKLSIGKVAITLKEMYSNEAIMAFIDNGKAKIIPSYLYYLLLSKDWNEGTNKAVMGKTLNKATLSQVKINIHKYEEQLKIIEVLDKVKSIITLRKQQLEQLDLLIKARFVEMFGEPECNNLNWDICKLSELCNVSSSKRIYQNEQTSFGVPFLRISDLVNKMDTGKLNSELFISEEKFKELYKQNLVPKTGDILITARGTLGRCYIVEENDRFYFQDGMITWLSNFDDRIIQIYISYLFSMSGFRKQIDSLQAGSTVAYLSIAMTKKLDIMLPPLDLQNQFAAFVEQVDKSKVVCESL